jgi:hypothetical protein
VRVLQRSVGEGFNAKAVTTKSSDELFKVTTLL